MYCHGCGLELPPDNTGLFCDNCLRECRYCGKARIDHNKDTRGCPQAETSFWPVGEPGGG
jgi:hypothetical protein